MTVAFFGHGNAPRDIEPSLDQAIIRLIEENENITFLVGTHGHFDGMARRVLERLAPRYPMMKYRIVLAYLPVKREENRFEGLPTMLPESIENVPKKFAISYRKIIWSRNVIPLSAISRMIGVARLNSLKKRGVKGNI